MKLVIVFVLFALLSTASYATSVSVTTVQSAGKAGVLTNLYFESANAASGSAPTVNTALAQPSGTGSFTLTRGSTDGLWSSQFASAKTISAGTWVFDVWAKGATAGAGQKRVFWHHHWHQAGLVPGGALQHFPLR